MVRILDFHCYGPGSIPGQGSEILQAVKDKREKKIAKKWKQLKYPSL